MHVCTQCLVTGGLHCVQVPLFQGMAPADLESLAVVLTEKVYPPKSVVHYQGSEVEDVFFIQRGHVKVLLILCCHMLSLQWQHCLSHSRTPLYAAYQFSLAPCFPLYFVLKLLLMHVLPLWAGLPQLLMLCRCSPAVCA